MKVISVYAENFASYEKLEYSFDSQGVTLIHGPTGAGKSTLCDVIPWGLFGITSKGGKADEVKSWNGGVTKVTICVENAEIVRIRGKTNDLYYYKHTEGLKQFRGKDLTDTQKQINELLGMTPELYLAGAYFHEFSQTAQFFTTNAKNRRAITESLVDLSLPIRLQERIKTETKTVKSQIESLDINHTKVNAKIDSLKSVLENIQQKNDSWAHEINNRISALQSKADNFEIVKAAQINSLAAQIEGLEKIQFNVDENKVKALPKTTKCKECGKVSENLKRAELENELLKQKHHNEELERLINRLDELQHSENTYQTQIQDFKAQTNPHTSTIIKLSKDIDKELATAASIETEQAKVLDEKLNLEILADAVNTFRSELIENTVESLETETTRLLREHFEGEISVGFTITDSDKLEVSINKDGNEAAYTQLSKGQRQMLKLCFGIAVMKSVATHHALDFRQIFLDEALDGLDDSNKMKAIQMLETVALDYDSVYIVEHSETVKAMIENKVLVELVDGRSEINR